MNTEDPVHDIILDSEQRKAFIQMLQKNLDSLRNQEIEVENKKSEIQKRINENMKALNNIQRIDSFIDNNGMSAVKIFCETHNEEMNKADSSRLSEEDRENGKDPNERNICKCGEEINFSNRESHFFCQ